MAAYQYYRPQRTDPPAGYVLEPDPRGTNFGSKLVNVGEGKDYASQEDARLKEVRRQEANWNRIMKISRLASLGVLGAGAGVALAGGGSAAAGGGAASGGSTGGATTLGSMYSSPGAYSGLFGGGATAGGVGATVAPAVVAPAATGGGFSLGSLFSSPALGAGVNAFTSWMGGRAANKANQASIAASSSALDRQIALEQARMDAEGKNAELDRAAILAQNQAANELKRRELGASEEERAYLRSISERSENRRTLGERVLGGIFGWGG